MVLEKQEEHQRSYLDEAHAPSFGPEPSRGIVLRAAVAVGGVAHQHLHTTAGLLVRDHAPIVVRRLAVTAHRVLLAHCGAAFSRALGARLDANGPHRGADAAQSVATVLAHF